VTILSLGVLLFLTAEPGAAQFPQAHTGTILTGPVHTGTVRSENLPSAETDSTRIREILTRAQEEPLRQQAGIARD